MENKHQTVLITGAGHRIGRALALGLAADGWAVAVHYAQSQAAAAEVVAQINQPGGRAESFQCDLADDQAVQQLTGNVTGAFGPLTALINNASLFERDTAETLTAQSWDAHLDVNLKAPALLMRDFAAQADKGGNIINIIDQRVWRLTPDFASYTASKAGLWTLTQTFAQALATKSIRVNGIGPGPTLANQRQEQSEFDKQTRLVPLGHGANPQDILDGVRYILSASAMTGQMIALDGGQHLAWETPDVTQVVE